MPWLPILVSYAQSMSGSELVLQLYLGTLNTAQVVLLAWIGASVKANGKHS